MLNKEGEIIDIKKYGKWLIVSYRIDEEKK